MPPHDTLLAWTIIIPATACVIIRPFRLPEAIWALLGAVALIAFSLLPAGDALTGVRCGDKPWLSNFESSSRSPTRFVS